MWEIEAHHYQNLVAYFEPFQQFICYQGFCALNKCQGRDTNPSNILSPLNKSERHLTPQKSSASSHDLTSSRVPSFNILIIGSRVQTKFKANKVLKYLQWHCGGWSAEIKLSANMSISVIQSSQGLMNISHQFIPDIKEPTVLGK